jgi:formiminotetrahydrofolate cyclodeaminase
MRTGEPISLPAQREKNWMAGSVDYLRLPLSDLVGCFASGSPCPGVGTAAGVAGAVSAGLIGTVAQIICRNETDSDFRPRAAEIAERAAAIGERLARSIAEDARIFQRVIEARRARDAADGPEQDDLAARAVEALRPAIELPLDVAETCLELARLGKELLDHGMRTASSDARTAVSLALAGAESSLAAVALNLESFEADAWVAEKRETSARIWGKLLEIRDSLPSPLAR